jgi:hypothetical protein
VIDDPARIDVRSREREREQATAVVDDVAFRRPAVAASVAAILGQQHVRAEPSVCIERVRPVIDELTVAVREQDQRRGAFDVARGQKPRFDLAVGDVDREANEPGDARGGRRVGAQQMAREQEAATQLEHGGEDRRGSGRLEGMERSRIVAFVVVIAACGPEVGSDAEVEARCASDGPTKLLDLSETDPLVGAAETDRFDDRRIILLQYGSNTAPFGTEIDRVETWSVGMCGEDPQLLEPSAAYRSDEAWPDALLTCREATGELVALDPRGQHAPNVVMHGASCYGVKSPHGLVIIEQDDPRGAGSAVFFPWVDDPWTQSSAADVLFANVAIVESTIIPGSYSSKLSVGGDSAFDVTTTGEIVRASLVDDTASIEATDVRDFVVSEDGRWLLWQDVDVTNDDPASPAGAITLKDLVDGSTLELSDAALAGTWKPLEFIEHGVVQLKVGATQRVVFLSTSTSVDLPEGTALLHRVDDGRWIVGAPFRGPYSLFDPPLDASRPFFGEEGVLGEIDGGAEILAAALGIDSPPEAPLWFVPWDGEPELLAARASPGYARHSDGRVVTTLDVAEGLGSLVVAAPNPDDEQRIDDHVLSYATVNAHDDAIVYGVLDGDRTGVWLTELAE